MRTKHGNIFNVGDTKSARDWSGHRSRPAEKNSRLKFGIDRMEMFTMIEKDTYILCKSEQ